MLKNRRLARAIADVGFYEFRRQMEYKCRWYGSKLVVASRTFPSSKMCSQCGHRKKELSLSEREYKCHQCGLEIDRDLNASEREYKCHQCGLEIDRDLNAALNLVAISLPETENACEEEVRLLADSLNLQRAASKKQELNINPDSMSRDV
ncbi:MAG: RNA-guided endonuclease InsQ/TnpB family protein [Candidatus Thorarchaeota archaeon]